MDKLLTADVTLDVTYGDSAGTACSGDDARLANARKPMAHTASHNHGGGDEIATITPAANAIPKAGADGKISKEWLPEFVGGGATVVSTPVITIGDNVPVGKTVKFSVSATSLLAPAQSVTVFTWSVAELGIVDQSVEAAGGNAEISLSVPEDTAIGTQLTITVMARDALGNASRASSAIATVAAYYVVDP